ncbi:LysR family transcriptional regulator [Roseibium litorale]|uniref:LysR family transcriptional regulator n=1 Tax=Roseibium litorale TaxID=2803841 RepID=A0ABR9CR12_9HYPH|nr:LysR family transcriptional regulator [Roseibium litorale]MBD8892722.1 LysR family transcriptional regulator [Roseibium litorale]
MDKINLHRLQIFRTVFETLSVTEAARKLKLSQPTVSRHLALFEKELELNLFDNVRGRLEPTWEAHRLYDDSNGLFERLQTVGSSVESIRRGSGEALRIMASNALCMSILPTAVGRLYHEIPDLDILVEGGGLRAQLEALREGTIDVGLGGTVASSADLRQTIIGRLPLVAVVPLTHALAHRTVFDLRELENHESVMHNPNAPMGSMIEESLEQRGIQPRRALSSFTIPFAIGLARHSRLITMVDCMTASFFAGEDMKIIPLSKPLHVDLAMLELSRKPSRRSAILFRDALADAYRKASKAFVY